MQGHLADQEPSPQDRERLGGPGRLHSATETPHGLCQPQHRWWRGQSLGAAWLLGPISSGHIPQEGGTEWVPGVAGWMGCP